MYFRSTVQCDAKTKHFILTFAIILDIGKSVDISFVHVNATFYQS